MNPLCAGRIYNGAMPFESITKKAEADFPTAWGHFRILGYEGVVSNPVPCNALLPAPATRIESAVALVMGDIHAAPPIVRIHSQCLTGDVFHSLRCDCQQQLHAALDRIAQEGAGILLYEQQEGRGIGLMAKLQAYELQDRGRDTVEANLELGYAADCRHFELPAEILKSLKLSAVRLITNNPEKMGALEGGWNPHCRADRRNHHCRSVKRTVSPDETRKNGPSCFVKTPRRQKGRPR